MKTIPLTQDKVALIDDQDYDFVNQFKWFARKARNGYYACTWIGPWREIKPLDMHNLVIGKPESGQVVDHIDRDGLNNQRSNLRICTRAQNCYNRTPSGKSKYLGVSPVKRNSGIAWRAFIAVNKQNKYLGIFKSEEDAAKAYNDAAIKLHGEYAYLNKLHNPQLIIAEYDKGIGATIAIAGQV